MNKVRESNRNIFHNNFASKFPFVKAIWFYFHWNFHFILFVTSFIFILFVFILAFIANDVDSSNRLFGKMRTVHVKWVKNVQKRWL